MSSKATTKAINKMDAYLSEKGLTRKAITRDDTCLFRAVSEKLFYSQCHHEHVKTKCLEYIARHKNQYQPFFEEALDERVQKLQEHKIEAGHVEMVILSWMYRMDFEIFHPSSQEPCSLTQNRFDRKIFLCYVEDNHYDLVYTRSYLQAAAICQSVVYEVLYRRVFKLDTELEEAVLFLELQKQLPRDTYFSDCFLAHVTALIGIEKVDILQRLCGRSSPPVPYRIAKALHPVLYRNVELDIVQEEKRGAKLDPSRALKPGDKCQVVLDEKEGHPYNAHIQSIDFQEGTVVVFVEELGVKETFQTSSIRPLPIPRLNSHGGLPIVDIASFPYWKKNRRRKHQPLVPHAIDGTDSPLVYSCQFPNSHSASRSVYSSTNTFGGTTGLTTSCQNTATNLSNSYLSSTKSSNSNLSNTNFISNNFHTAALPLAVAFTDQVQSYPPDIYISPTEGGNPCGEFVEPPVLANFETAYLSYQIEQTESERFFTPVDPSLPYCVMSVGPPSSQAPMYWMPVVAVPYNGNIGQVNMGWSPSQDPYAKDLNVSGVEYYRMSSQANSYPSGVMYPSSTNPEMVPQGAIMVDGCGNYSNMGTVVYPDTTITTACNNMATSVEEINMAPAMSVGESSKIVSKSGTSQTESVGSKVGEDSVNSAKNLSNPKDDKKTEVNRSIQNKKNTPPKEKNGSVNNKDVTNVDDDNDSVTEGMDVGSDGDSGCSSECAELSPVAGTDTGFSSSELPLEHGETSPNSEQTTVTDTAKPRGKRRYYMYGNHKLIKPIKEIPLRFQILLAETSAAKARCEGQPIYMQQPAVSQQPVYDVVYYPNDSMQPQLNANASCFVPNQNGCVDPNVAPTYMHDGYTFCPVSGYTNTVPSNLANNPANTNPNSLQPTPLFVPPPVPTGPSQCSNSSSSQNCQTIIVYSSQSSHSSAAPTSNGAVHQIRTVSMPPPSYPPPSTMSLPPMDQMPVNSTPCLSPAVNQVLVSVPAPHTQSKTTVSHADHHMKPQALHSTQTYMPKKQQVVLNVPPPNTHRAPPPNTQMVPSPMTPPPHHCMLTHSSSPTYLSVPQQLVPPSHIPAPQAPPTVLHAAPTSATNAPIVNNPGCSTTQYMYVYPSPPAGQPASAPQVMYMVSPAYPSSQTYQQQGVLVPPNCPVPVQ